jgi:hypothetical protein
MVRVQAVSLGHTLDVVSPAAGVVHSVFAHAVNMTIRGDLWTLLADDKGDLSYGIRVGRPRFDCLGLRSGDAVRMRSGFLSLGTRIVVDCRAAPRWEPPAEADLALGLEHRLARIAEATRGRSWPESQQMANAVRTSVHDADSLPEVLAGVVGRGPGATPSGDDVLVGILAVLTSPHSGSAGATAAQTLRKSLLPLLPTTTDISGHLLRQAACGMFSRDLHELRSALIEATPSCEQDLTLRRVLETGATSGADTCEGLLAFARFYFTSHRDRVSA